MSFSQPPPSVWSVLIVSRACGLPSGSMAANGSLETDDIDPASQEIRVVTTFAAAICMSLCCLVGVFGNVMSAVIFLHPLMRSPINVLLAGLSLIDLTMILLSVLVLIMPSLNLILQNPALWRAYGFTTVFLYPLCTAAHTSSIWTFVLVSVERYNATCKPLKRHKLLTCRQARIAQTFVVVLALCYNSVRVWEYRDTPINATDPIGNVEPYLRVRADYFLSYYTILYIVTHFVTPFTIILILNIFIIRSVRFSDQYLSTRSGSNSPGHQNRHIKQQRNTTNMIVVITALFTLCNVSPFILNVWEAMDPELFYGPYQTSAYVALDLSNTFVLFNSSITFVIYISYCRRYRVLFRYFARSLCYFRKSFPVGYELAADPSFRRYSVVTNSGCEAVLEPSAAAFAFYAKRYQHGRQYSLFDTEAFRSAEILALRRGERLPRRSSAFHPPTDFRDRVFTN